MTVNIMPTEDDVRDSFQRVYERIKDAEERDAQSIEITQQEAFDLFHRQTTFDVATGQQRREGVNMSEIAIGNAGWIMGFPCTIVERLSPDASEET